MKDRMGNLLIWLLASVGLVWLDQYTKLLAVQHLKGNDPYVIAEGVAELLYSENRGAAFGMFQGRQILFLLIGVIVLCGAAYAMFRMPSWKDRRYHGMKLCVILITSGAIGNMIDRVVQGYVVDFLYFKWIDFPIFNVADIYVTVATFFLILLLCFYYKDEDLEVFRFHPQKGEKV